MSDYDVDQIAAMSVTTHPVIPNKGTEFVTQIQTDMSLIYLDGCDDGFWDDTQDGLQTRLFSVVELTGAQITQIDGIAAAL